MPDNEKASQSHLIVKNKKDENQCPQKEGDNCLVPGGYNDSEPIGGA